jgi:sRNA-binding protein
MKVSCVLAAIAFVVGFRVHASSTDAGSAAAAPTLNAARASALDSDGARKTAATVRLADVAALPDLRGEPRSVVEARAAKAAAAKRAEARAKAAAERRAKARAERRKKAAEKRKRERAAARKRAAARNKAAAQAPRVVATPVPTPVYRPPVYTPPAQKKKSYVGKDFDSKG